MSCINYAARNNYFFKSYVKRNSAFIFLPNFSTSSHRATELKKESSNPISELKDYVTPPADMHDEGEQFRYLLRNSSFINMGDPENKVVQGKIFHVVKDDLYIDFGWKFYCVCPRPAKHGRLYVRGTGVLLKIKDLELSSKFLGSDKDLTLLEADASIIKMLYSPVKD